MARIEHIKRRLENWGIWASRCEGGASGFATRSILTVDVWARGTYNGAMIPVFEEEAQETERAVASFKKTRPTLARTVILYHVENLGVLEIAHRERCAQSTVHARLAQADQAVAMWLADRAREREQAARRTWGSFPT